jgi:hypothetical protein
VRLGRYKKAYPTNVPAAIVALKGMSADARAKPLLKQRVAYVVVAGAPGSPLYARCHCPLEVMRDRSLLIDAKYYIVKVVIPALQRLFGCVGTREFYSDVLADNASAAAHSTGFLDVGRWFREMKVPRDRRRPQYTLSQTEQMFQRGPGVGSGSALWHQPHGNVARALCCSSAMISCVGLCVHLVQPSWVAK